MTSNEKKIGLSTLQNRLNKLENQTIQQSDNDDELSKLVSRLKNKELENKKNTMKSILEHFKTDLTQNIIVDENNVVKILIFCIKYVEQNHIRLSGYLGVKTCSEFKHELCKSLLQHVCSVYSNEMIDLAISTLCSEIYPKLNDIEEILKDDKEEPKKKKSFFGKTIK
jgi:uncharacterized coiled-coil protein SlyX